MVIDIIGYVTELHGKNGFTIKVTSDRVDSRSFSDIQVSKEVKVLISPYYYPNDYYTEFEIIAEGDKYHRDKVNKCLSLRKVLRRGDQVKCAVFIVDGETHNGVTIQKINKRRNDIKTYADFTPLWLYPNDDFFKRLEVDSWESLKFRKQWFYTCINRKKCEEITGSEWNDYRKKPWINKHPIRIFLRIWGIRAKTIVSNLWRKFTRQEKSIVLGIIGIVATIIFGIISC